MIEQPQLDTNLYTNQLEPKILNKTPVFVVLVYCYPAYLQ